MGLQTRILRSLSLLMIISLACVSGSTSSARAALKRAPVTIKEFTFQSGAYYISGTVASGSCFSEAKTLFRDPAGKTVDVSKASKETYPYLTIYFSVIPKDSACLKGTQVTLGNSGPYRVNATEIRDYTTKKVLWNVNQITKNPISSADAPIESPIVSFVASRHIYCETCKIITQEIALIELNGASQSALTPLSSQFGFAVVGRRSDALIVQNTSPNRYVYFADLWLVTSSGWKLLSNDTSHVHGSILLNADMKSYISSQSQGFSSVNTALIMYPLQGYREGQLEKVLFDAKKYGGGFISSLSASPDDKFGYFTHISKGVSNLYQINLATNKLSKLGKTVDGFNLEAIDSDGNFIGIIKNRADAENAPHVVRISLKSLTVAQIFETGPFTFSPSLGPAVIASGKYLIFNNDSSRQLTIFDSTGIEKALNYRFQTSLSFLTALPSKWIDKGSIPAIPDNM